MKYSISSAAIALAFALSACVDAPEAIRPAEPAVTPRDMAMASQSPYLGPPGATLVVPVVVPPGLASPPFDVPRSLTIPPGFAIEVVARIPKARFLLTLPGGDFLVSQPSTGSIILVRRQSGTLPLLFTFASGLKLPHDMVLATVGGARYLYIGESNRVTRAPYVAGDTIVGALQPVVTALPDHNSPGLGGSYAHSLKNIAVDGNGKLYVSIASSCNVCLSDGLATPVRAAIYQYNADGSGARLFARGLRNAEGLAFVPGTSQLWITGNNRDNIRYPFNDGSGNYGRVIPAYVDDHPPELFTRVRLGDDFGWPFCNANPDTPNGYDDMPFDRDYDFLSSNVDCTTKQRVMKGIQAHSAPLGLRFLQSSSFPAAYRNGVVIALHGSWNRTQPTGYKVIYFPWNSATKRPMQQADFVAGWLDPSGAWGRPVDIAGDGSGGLLISDDRAGAIYRLK